MATNNKYGNLLDKYMDDRNVDYETKIKREAEAKDKYGGLLDNAKPNYKIYDDMVNVDNMCRNLRQQREAEYEQANRRRQERIEREKREEQERIDKHDAFVNSYLKKKEAEQKAAEEKRKQAEREQNFLNGIQRLIDIKDETAAMIARTSRMLKADEEKRREHEEKMTWYRKQERKG